MLIRFNSLFENLNIKEESFYIIISKLLEQFKKSKNTLCLDFVDFLLDIKFSQLATENNSRVLEILETKNKL